METRIMIETKGGTQISDVNTGGGAFISGDVRSGVFIGRDISGDFVGRDKVVIGSRYTIYTPVNNFFTQYGIIIAIVVITLMSIALAIIFFWSDISALWNMAGYVTQIVVAVLTSALGLFAAYMAVRQLLQRSTLGSRMTIDSLKDFEKELFEEINEDVDSIFVGAYSEHD